MFTMRNLIGAISTTVTNAAGVDLRPTSARALPGSHLFHPATNDDDRGIKSMRNSTTVGAIVRRLSNDTARPDWHLELPDPDGEPQILDDHAFLRVWNHPNQVMTPTRRSLMYLGQHYLELLGECFLHVVTTGRRGSGIPVELYPINPMQMSPVPATGSFIGGWVHTSAAGVETPLTHDQIIQIKYTNPDNPYRGLAPLAAALVEVDASELAAQYQRKFFLNSALPGGFVTSDLEMTEGEFDDWVERWDEQHAGVDNAWRIHLMDKGGKFIPQTTSLADMLLTDLIESHRDTIREAWGMSRTMLGMAESDTNRATAEAAEYIYSKYTLQDRLDLWAEAGANLLSRFPSLRSRQGRARSRWRPMPTEGTIPVDMAAEAVDRDSRINAAATLMAQGAEPASALEAFGLPAVEFKEPEPAPALPPGDPVQQQLPIPDDPAELVETNGYHHPSMS